MLCSGMALPEQGVGPAALCGPFQPDPHWDLMSQVLFAIVPITGAGLIPCLVPFAGLALWFCPRLEAEQPMERCPCCWVGQSLWHQLGLGLLF